MSSRLEIVTECVHGSYEAHSPDVEGETWCNGPARREVTITDEMTRRAAEAIHDFNPSPIHGPIEFCDCVTRAHVGLLAAFREIGANDE